MKTGSNSYWLVIAISFLTQLSNALAAQAVAPLAPIFQPELGVSKAEVGLFSSAAFAGAWGVLLVAGSLTDRFGVRWVTSIGQLAAGSLVLAMAAVGTFAQAFAVMFIAGVGRGVVGPGITKSVMDWIPPTRRATAMGINQTGIPLAGIIAASCLPGLALTIGWRSAIATVGIAIIACGLATLLLYRDPQQMTAVARPGSAMRSNLREVLRNRRLWVVGGMGAIFAAMQFGLITYLALYFKEIVLVPHFEDQSTRIVVAGGFLALSHVGSIVARVFWGIVCDRLFRGRRVALLSVVTALAVVMFGVVSTLDSHYPLWMLPVIVFLFGFTAMGWQGLHLAVAAEAAGAKLAGTGIGLSMTFSQIGFVSGPPLFGLILDVTASYQVAWLSYGALAATGSLMAFFLARQERSLPA